MRFIKLEDEQKAEYSDSGGGRRRMRRRKEKREKGIGRLQQQRCAAKVEKEGEEGGGGVVPGGIRKGATPGVRCNVWPRRRHGVSLDRRGEKYPAASGCCGERERKREREREREGKYTPEQCALVRAVRQGERLRPVLCYLLLLWSSLLTFKCPALPPPRARRSTRSRYAGRVSADFAERPTNLPHRRLRKSR